MSDTFSTAETDQEKPIPIDETELKRLNEEMVLSELITPDRLYVDLALLRDYNVGALASFHQERKANRTPEEHREIYQSLLDALPSYQERKFNDIAHYFPRFGVGNDEIQQRLHDPRYASYIFNHAPITPYLATLRGQIAVNINHSAVIGKRDPIVLTINTYPLKLPVTDHHLIGLYLKECLQVNVEIIFLDVTKLTLHDVVRYDEFYTYYFPELLSHDEIREGYTALRFIRKRLYATRIFGNAIIPTMNVDHEAMVVKSHFDVLTLFSFVHPRLFSAISPKA